jgi:hypothetical protein
MDISHWMSWEGGVDLVGTTSFNLEQPNVIVHIARMVQTPIGAAPAGMILIPNFDDPTASPQIVGFVSTDPAIGAYFGPNIFAGTPFEHAPVLTANISVEIDATTATTKVVVGEMEIETRLQGLGTPTLVHREPSALPFYQQGVERKAGLAVLKVNGKEHPVFVPEVGMTGGPGAVLAPTGLYAR